MKCRVDFVLIQDGQPIAELSAAGESVESAIQAAMITVAPHLEDAREVLVLRVGYLCRCGHYHPVAQAIEGVQHNPEDDEEPEAEVGALN